ncbi:MAG: Acetyl-CoA:oxalate CoA-transferase [Flavobacteriales bacterium]|nr:Acetyl-CoA:oxalate CoA-transferase [Flavobacteriales bacterium]
MLKDLVVIELAGVLAGPDVGMFFSELGAKVIKVENKQTSGDVTRTWKLPTENKTSSVSAYFSSVNWNKKYLQLNLKQEVEQKKIHELVKKADVVIANFKKGDDIKLQMDYKTLKKINPKLIYGAITGFGSNSERVAFDVVLQAETGFMSMNGTKKSGALKMPVALIDVLAAHQLKQGLLLALLKREKQQKGSFVEVSLYDAAISALKNQASNWLMNNYIPETIGSLHPNIAPYGEVFTTKDNKQIVLAIGSDNQFFKLLDLFDATQIKSSKKYQTNPLRVNNRKSLTQKLIPFFQQYNRKPLMDLLIKNNIPAGAIKNLKEVFEDTAAQNLINEETIDGVKTKRVKTVVFKIS